MADITTTIGALRQALPALDRVAQLTFDKDGGAKVRYHVLKLAKLVRPEVREHFDEPADALMKQLGTPVETTKEQLAANPKLAGSKFYNFEPDKMTAFSTQLDALAAVEVTIPWGPLTHAMLEPYPAVSAADLEALGPLFSLDDDAPKTPKS